MAEAASHMSNRIVGGMFGLELPLGAVDPGPECAPGFLSARHI